MRAEISLTSRCKWKIKLGLREALKGEMFKEVSKPKIM